MNKSTVINEVARATGRSITETEVLINAFLTKVQDGLKKDRCVQISGFGTFVLRQRTARKGRNPMTGAIIDVNPSISVGFRAGKPLKGFLNQ